MKRHATCVWLLAGSGLEKHTFFRLLWGEGKESMPERGSERTLYKLHKCIMCCLFAMPCLCPSLPEKGRMKKKAALRLPK